LPILRNAIFIKIDPCGEESAMTIPHSHGIGIGNEVALLGHHLHM
jgi:hypothetical protein